MSGHDFLFKVVVIGDSGVGKSSLIEKYTKDSKDVTVEYKQKAIKVEDIVIKGQIWDVGVDKYKAYSGAVGALLVYSVNSKASFKNCEVWLNELKSFNAHPGMVVMLVGNKCDLNDTREVPEDEAKSFALKNNLTFIETSAKDDTGVGEAFERILLDIYKQQTSTGQPTHNQQQQQHQPPTNQSHVPQYPHYGVPPPVHDPLRVPPPHRPDFGIGPSGDLYPSPGAGFGYIPGLDPHGGNLIGPHHPGFGIPDPFAPNPSHFPRGGRGSLPPRGARFDPFGPPGTRPYPDNDHLPPPGGHFDDDMYM
jgi:small GTP-binding protein